MKSKTESDDPKRDKPNTERVELRRKQLLNERVEPSCKQSNIDKVDPKRVHPQTASVEPILKKLRIERVEPR
jgi:hypothetical protein